MLDLIFDWKSNNSSDWVRWKRMKFALTTARSFGVRSKSAPTLPSTIPGFTKLDLPSSLLADRALIQHLDVRDAFDLVKIPRFYGLQHCLQRGSAHTPLRRRGYPTLLHIDQEHHTFEGAKGADHHQQANG